MEGEATLHIIGGQVYGLQGSVGRSPGQYHGRGAAGAPGDIRRQPHRDVSNLCEDSTRSRDISGIGAFSKRNCQKIDFD